MALGPRLLHRRGQGVAGLHLKCLAWAKAQWPVALHLEDFSSLT